jgi:hypothetical protein
MKKTITWSAIIEIRESKDKDDKLQIAFDYMSSEKGAVIIKTKVLKDSEAEEFAETLSLKQNISASCSAHVSGTR